MMLLAQVVSRVFEPMMVLAAVFFVGALRLGLSWTESVIWLVGLLGPTFYYRVWAKKSVDLDWDIQDRKKRITPLTGLLLFLTFITVVAWFARPALASLFIIFLWWAIGFFVLTVVWTKVSGHTAVAALASGLLVIWFGWSVWPFLLIVPVVGWSRVKTNNHTILQVIAGMTYSWLLLGLFFV